MSDPKLGVEILSSGPVTIREAEAVGWSENGRTVYIEGEVGSIQISRNGEAEYSLRVFPDGRLVLTTYRGRLTMTGEVNLCLNPTHPWD